jgi:hypothetical protein
MYVATAMRQAINQGDKDHNNMHYHSYTSVSSYAAHHPDYDLLNFEGTKHEHELMIQW